MEIMKVAQKDWEDQLKKLPPSIRKLLKELTVPKLSFNMQHTSLNDYLCRFDKLSLNTTFRIVTSDLQALFGLSIHYEEKRKRDFANEHVSACLRVVQFIQSFLIDILHNTFKGKGNVQKERP